MTTLDKLMELNNLAKENRKNRLEDKLRQQEYYGEIEVLFDPLTKTLNTHNEQNLALGEQALRAMDWKIQELDKQTKAIEEVGFQIGETTLQIQKACSQIRESASNVNETLKETTKETQYIATDFVDTNTPNVLPSMGPQTILQLKLNLVDLLTRRYKMNGVKITLEQGAFLVKDDNYELSD